MIETATFNFAAPPRTGSTWFLLVCEALDILMRSRGQHTPRDQQRRQWKGRHIPPDTPDITIVRDPAEWLHSYFYHTPGYILVPAVDGFRDERARDFTEYVAGYLQKPLNRIGTMFQTFHAETTFQTESLQGQVESFFGVDLSHVPRQNEGTETIPLSQRCRQTIYDHEPEFCKLWGYG